MPDNITRKTFEQAPVDTKLLLLWDEVHGLCSEMRTCRERNEPRLRKLENRKRADRTVSASAGFFGGLIAMLGKLLFWGHD